MRRLIPMMLILAASLAPAVRAQSPASERMEELVERFMASVDRWGPSAGEQLGDPFLAEDLLRLNPGRDADVAQIVEASGECSDIIVAAMPRAARNAARALGEERLARLVEFVEGPAGEDPGRSDETDARDEYGRWMYSIPAHLEAADIARVERCYAGLFESATRLGLRVP